MSILPRHSPPVVYVGFLVWSLVVPGQLIAQQAGFQPSHAYDQGPTDSIDLYHLNPIVTQSLSPTYSISDTLEMSATAYHTGFTWYAVIIDPNDPATTYSRFQRNIPPGIVGAGWNFNPGRIWADSWWNTTSGCDLVRSVYIREDGGQHGFSSGLNGGNSLDFRFGVYEFEYPSLPCYVPSDTFITLIEDWGKEWTWYSFDPNTGALIRKSDRWYHFDNDNDSFNEINYAYMQPSDFLAIDPTATLEQYTYDYQGTHPVSGRFNISQTVRAPKTMTDSMGRQIEFKYGLIPGYSKFLLTEIHVPTPSGTGIYRLSYQLRSITTAPPGWPEYSPLDPNSGAMPFLVTVELPGSAPALTYNYDYNAHGELSEIRYSTGARTVFGWGDIVVNGNPYNRGVKTKLVYPEAGGGGYQWTYDKGLYPETLQDCVSNADIRDRDRTIVTDPSGNEIEYRFIGSSHPIWLSEFIGLPGAVRHYRGQAPRYDEDACGLGDLVPGSTPGELVRSTTYYYSPGNWAIKRAEITTYYDDPLDPTAVNMSNPTSWDSFELNAESMDPTLYTSQSWSLPSGYARFEIAGNESSKSYGPFPGFYDNTESGNLVGIPRRIEGDYTLNVPRWGYKTPRIISQGSDKSRTDYRGCGFSQCDRREIRRLDPYNPPADPNTVMPGDVLITYQYSNPPSNPHPMEKHSLTRITYAGGDNGDPNIPAYTVNMTSEYGSLATSQFAGVPWLEIDSDIGATGVTTESRVPSGFSTQYSYDELGRRVSVSPTAPELATIIEYNKVSDVFLDNESVMRTHWYTNATTVSKGTEGQADYEESYQEFDGFGRPVLTERLTETGATVRQTQTYDGLGSVIFVSEWHDPNNPSPLGTTTSYLDASGHRDPFGRPTRTTTADGAATDIEYFGLNSGVTVHDLNGDPNQSATTIYYRDYKNRLRIVDAPAGADAIYAYDLLGDLKSVRLVDQLAHDIWNSDPNVPSLQTDRFGVLNASSQDRTYSHDSLGRLVSTTHPEKGQTTYDSYDARGNVLLMTDADGNQHRYTYDEAGRLAMTEVKLPTGSFNVLSETVIADDPNAASAFGAGALGRPVQFKAYEDGDSNPISVRSVIYDGLNGRISQEENKFSFWETDPNTVADIIGTSFTYNNGGQLRELIYPSVDGSGRLPTRVRYSYAHGFLTQLESNRQGSDPNIMAPLTTGISYDLAGGLSSLQLANGVTETIQVDNQFRPAQLTVQQGAATLWNSGLYQYDGVSNIIAIGTQTFEYDSIGRLISADVLAPSDPNIYHQDYTYDDYGNMVSRLDSAPAGVGNQVFVVDPNTNRLDVLNPSGPNLIYQYNDKGEVQNDGVFSYSWDLAGRLRAVHPVDGSSPPLAIYSYDGRDYRVRTGSGDEERQTVFVRDSSGRVLTEFSNPASTQEPHWRKDYIYAFGRHIALVENIEPETPTGITSSASQAGGSPQTHVNLAWLPASDPDLYGYDVYRWDGVGGPNYVLLTSVPQAGTSYHDEDSLTAGQAYYYQLLAVDTGWVESTPTSPRKIMVDDPNGPPVPPGFAASVPGCNTVNTSWTAVQDQESDMAGYNLYRKHVEDNQWPTTPQNGSLPITGTSYLDSGGTVEEESYQYRLEAIDAAGRKSPFTQVETVTNPQCGGGGGPPEPPVRVSLPEVMLDSTSTHRFIGDHSGAEVNYRLRYYHVDHLGTPRVITDSLGAVVAEANLFPFGDPVPWSTSAGNTHWFTGHERLSSKEMDYMLARYYSPTTVRFYSPDLGADPGYDDREMSCGSSHQGRKVSCAAESCETEDHAGTPFERSWVVEESLTEQRQAHLSTKYTYVLNNPLLFTDPTGGIARSIVDMDPVQWTFGQAAASKPRPEAPRDPEACKRCLAACKRGGEAIRNFCRSIPPVGAYRALRATCWGLEFVGPVACAGWCYWWFC